MIQGEATIPTTNMTAADVTNPPAGLYLHIPFCFHKCHYCDFYSISEHKSDPAGRHIALVNRLVDELRFQTDRMDLRPITVFVGGGTPTLLRPSLWQRLLDAMGGLGVLQRVEEFTVEANPETVTRELMDILQAGGVNRLSIGCQSFDPLLLKALERWHDPANVTKAVDCARAAGITHINLDLIYAIPGQTQAMVANDLTAALNLAPHHISYYGLTYEPTTPLAQKLSAGIIHAIDEDTQRRMYDLVMDQLSVAGFEHYEVSNWARHDAPRLAACPQGRLPSNLPSPHRCRHNMIYWTNDNWLGVGPSAASHLAGHRWKNEPHLGRYLDSTGPPPTVDHETLSPQRRRGETLMLALRLRQGVPLDWLHRHITKNDTRTKVIADMIHLGMLQRTATHLRLTREGVCLADAILSQLL